MGIEIGTGITIGGGITMVPSNDPTTIGGAYGGGFYVGRISTTGNGVANYYLVVCPKASGQANSTNYASFYSYVNANSPIDGPTNSYQMYLSSSPAATFCENLTVGGFSDWYLPADSELEICYYNLKPTTTINAGNGGSNSYSVPSRSSTQHTAGIPAQTSATNFQNTNSEAFAANIYWSSTQYASQSLYRGYARSFSNGQNYLPLKTQYTAARAVRRVPI